jgi:hypothetical protein
LLAAVAAQRLITLETYAKRWMTIKNRQKSESRPFEIQSVLRKKLPIFGKVDYR